MIDRNGTEIMPGARCRFYASTREKWIDGTVRDTRTDGPFAGHARVDDGDRYNDDLHTNGFRVSAWVRSDEVEVLWLPGREEGDVP